MAAGLKGARKNGENVEMLSKKARTVSVTRFNVNFNLKLKCSKKSRFCIKELKLVADVMS